MVGRGGESERKWACWKAAGSASSPPTGAFLAAFAFAAAGGSFRGDTWSAAKAVLAAFVRIVC